MELNYRSTNCMLWVLLVSGGTCEYFVHVIATGGIDGWKALCCTVLYRTVLYCTLLYSTVLYCTIPYRTVPSCTLPYYTVMYCTVLYCTGGLCGNVVILIVERKQKCNVMLCHYTCLIAIYLLLLSLIYSVAQLQQTHDTQTVSATISYHSFLNKKL